ncbi:hypothetical protein [Propionicimonas sp.]|uniref:hypothetical protein n=1 Tax=Propionicimonas sp. TaxID=1955623 RepID=UPI0039E6EAA1
MSVEDRLRTGLHAAVDGWTPAVEASLEAVRGRQRRAGRVVAASAVALVLVVAGIAAVLIRTPSPLTGVPAASARATPGLVGRFDGDVAVPTGLAGNWELVFRPDGLLEVTPPAGYRGVLSAVLFATTGDSLTTTLFQEDVCSGRGVGRYTWQRTADGVRFVDAGDSCVERSQFLVGAIWRSTR